MIKKKVRDRGENRKGGDSQRESAVELAVGKRKDADKEEEEEEDDEKEEEEEEEDNNHL